MSTKTPRRVLVVEDDQGMQRFYARFFGSWHAEEFRWELARRADEALAALKEREWDIVVMDWVLPGPLSGLSIVRALRAQPKTRRLGIVVVTARSSPADAVTALDSGADDYIAKPFEEALLLGRLRSLARRT